MGGITTIQKALIMRILVTNDDGIHAPGLRSARRSPARCRDDVWVVAPETDQSGVAHSLSLNDPLRLREIGEKRYAVKGTPTDCVIMGVRHILHEQRPDLVLSGVNRGQNIAEDVTYSGTVAGAMEATLARHSRLRAVAGLRRRRGGTRCAGPAPSSMRPASSATCMQEGFPRDVLVNINFPDCEPDEVQGVADGGAGPARCQDLFRIEERVDGRNNPYFWIGFARTRSRPTNGTDLAALAARKIAVTPLRVDLTDEPTLTRFAQLFDKR